ncbi:hypothetical protein EJ02DRAFT_179936 [Clathrospora elynae]|uniref:Uncharacterized protein n=1 Tax=Clathrospora elynae TaxID=706981 RepID=A0A6A5S885_9PLEO|nr:hypothetical protein EJ02DRAFT_179936 [Clathrospora elynae]
MCCGWCGAGSEAMKVAFRFPVESRMRHVTRPNTLYWRPSQDEAHNEAPRIADLVRFLMIQKCVFVVTCPILRGTSQAAYLSMSE